MYTGLCLCVCVCMCPKVCECDWVDALGVMCIPYMYIYMYTGLCLCVCVLVCMRVYVGTCICVHNYFHTFRVYGLNLKKVQPESSKERLSLNVQL